MIRNYVATRNALSGLNRLEGWVDFETAEQAFALIGQATARYPGVWSVFIYAKGGEPSVSKVFEVFQKEEAA